MGKNKTRSFLLKIITNATFFNSIKNHLVVRASIFILSKKNHETIHLFIICRFYPI